MLGLLAGSGDAFIYIFPLVRRAACLTCHTQRHPIFFFSVFSLARAWHVYEASPQHIIFSRKAVGGNACGTRIQTAGSASPSSGQTEPSRLRGTAKAFEFF